MKSLKEKAYNKNNRFIIALDGPSASGKGAISKMLAEEFALQYIQSSIVYRGLAYVCIINNIDVTDISKIIKLSESRDLIELTKGIDLNQENIGNYASKISTIPEVRNNLNTHLVQMLQIYPRIIMEGRDITTVVAKDADIKIFITANVGQRAMRRFKQLQEQGKKCIVDDVLKLLEERDLRDSSRAVAPLCIAPDALVIDTSDISQDQVILKIKNYIELG
jgi:cytidylate kinase